MISDELFTELKEASIEIWQTYDDTHGYASEKVGRINSIPNVSDNYGTFIGMFDTPNQVKLYEKVGGEGKQLIDQWVGGMARTVALSINMGLY